MNESLKSLNQSKTESMKYEWTDYNCEGCRIHKMLKKREFDGKLLCKKCSKNMPLKLFTKTQKSGAKS